MSKGNNIVDKTNTPSQKIEFNSITYRNNFEACNYVGLKTRISSWL